MKILVCGGRDYFDQARVDRALDAIHKKHGVALLIHGGARGADTCGLLWAMNRGIPHQAFLADWDTHGKAAGPIRNQLMVDEGKPDAVVAFPGGRGTADMISRATTHGIHVWRVGDLKSAEIATPE